MLLDTTFEFHTDTPPGKDADAYSPTLRRYHGILWQKLLPSGTIFTLEAEPTGYLTHRSTHGVFALSSDAITTNLLGRAHKVIEQIPAPERPPDLGYTIGSSILFPGNRINGKATINGARGFHPRIADRFDLTLECIRRHYASQASPLTPTLDRYADFFELFTDFDSYVQFFLLQDLVRKDGRIAFFHSFSNFETPAVPRTVDDYLAYVAASNAFIRARNKRIDAYLGLQRSTRGELIDTPATTFHGRD